MRHARSPVDPELVERLNRGSVRRRFYPYDDDVIDWSVPLDDRWRYMPDGYSVVDGTRFADRLAGGQLARLTRWEVTQFFRSNHLGEHLLNQGFLALLHRTDPYDPAWRYMLHEVAEECQHMAMFNQWVRANGDIRTRGLGNHVWGVPASMLVPLVATATPALFLTLVLIFEVVGDDFARVSARDRSGRLHPTVVAIGRVHMAEEARHIAFARDWLARAVPKLSRVRRRLLAAAVDRLIRASDRVGLPVRWDPQLDGILTRPELAEALGSEHRRALVRRVWGALRDDLEAIGIV